MQEPEVVVILNRVTQYEELWRNIEQAIHELLEFPINYFE